MFETSLIFKNSLPCSIGDGVKSFHLKNQFESMFSDLIPELSGSWLPSLKETKKSNTLLNFAFAEVNQKGLRSQAMIPSTGAHLV